jgi:uncharacterized protein YcbK (DUF882 family)
MTELQINSLLCYLGYFDTKEALKKFQEDNGLSVSGTCDEETEKALLDAVSNYNHEKDDFWGGIKYFTRDEFKCKCGKYCDGFPAEPEKKLVTVADRVREHFGNPAIVSSGVRCKQHNANVGGVANSRHLSGKAMDFRVSGKSAKEVLAYAQKQPEIRYAYAIDKNYIHMDIE